MMEKWDRNQRTIIRETSYTVYENKTTIVQMKRLIMYSCNSRKYKTTTIKQVIKKHFCENYNTLIYTLSQNIRGRIIIKFQIRL